MSAIIFDRLAAEFGAAVTRTDDPAPRVAPASSAEVAAVLGLAHEAGWRVRIEGRGTWMPTDAPADLTVTTAALNALVSVSPPDLVATVQTGVPLDRLSALLAEHRTRLAIDPPGAPDRSLGSILATATAGAAQHRFGPIRDHLLGLTVATADGRLVRAGGVVVKNVAGFDLAKLAVGGFGAFGIITEVSVRLRSLPADRRTLVARGEIDALYRAGRALAEGQIDASSLALRSPNARSWTLVAEVAGTVEGVAAEVARGLALGADVGLAVAEEGGGTDGGRFLKGPVTIRAGALVPSLPDTVDLVVAGVGPGQIDVYLGRGGLRWAGTTTAAALVELRRQLAQREIPMTLERAPWPIRSAVGHFGAFREGVADLTTRLREVFDPARILVAPLDGGTLV